MMFVPKRYVIILLAFCGFLLMEMMEDSAEFYHIIKGDVDYLEVESEIQTMRFTLNLGCCLSLLGGVAATRYGGATVLGCGIMLSGFLNLLIPVFRDLHSDWVLMFKFVQGSLHGISTVAIADTWSRWFPIEERTTSVGIVYASYPLALMIVYTVFTEYPLIEYFHHIAGVLAIIWAAIWLFTIKNHPSEDEKLSTSEKQFFAQKVKFVDEKRTIPAVYPWKQILNCPPFWALNACAFIIKMGKSWNIPKDNFDKDEAIFIFLSWTISYIIVGLGSDYVRNRKIVPSTSIYKFCICGASIGEAFALLISMNGRPFNALMYYGLRGFSRLIIKLTLFTNLLDISPKYAGLLHGIQQFFSALGGVFWITEIVNRISSYVIVWFIVILYLTGAIIFYVWGSGETQQWDGSSNEEEELDPEGDEA